MAQTGSGDGKAGGRGRGSMDAGRDRGAKAARAGKAPGGKPARRPAGAQPAQGPVGDRPAGAGKSHGAKPAPGGPRKAGPAPGGKPGTLVVGSRGSALALAQSNMVCDWLREAHPGLEVRLEIIKTTGDADQKTRLSEFPAMGIFVKELQMGLLAGTIDCAVHSLKDVPEDEPEGLILAAFPEREDPRDVLVSDGRSLRELPPGARVGTGSPRRVLQLKAIRPDLEYVPLRGNVDTRVGKVRSGELQGAVLAAAGLRRLGRAADIAHSFSFLDMVPAIGQAALALECRAADARVRRILEAVNDDLTADAVRLERRFMKRVGGGCKVPMAAHVYPSGEGWRMLAVLGDAKTGAMVRVEQGAREDDEDWLLEEVAWRMEEECKDRGIALPRDLPAHFLLEDPDA